MQSLLLTGKTLNVIHSIGSDVVLQTVKTTSSIIIHTIKHITSIESDNILDIKYKLKNIDIEYKINVINSFIIELNTESVKLSKESVKLSILSINNILLDIKNELHNLKGEIDYHLSKYFNSWRYINCDDKINIIIQHNNILDKRFDLLIKLLSVYNI